MTSLAKLVGGRRGGVYRIAGAGGPDEAERRAREQGLWFVRADLGRARTAAGLHAAVARALRFPAHYGRNWDALADCMGDLSWLEGPGWVLLLDGAEGLAAAAPGDLATALEVLRGAAASWAEEGRPLVVLVRGGQVPRLPAAG